MTLCYFNVAQSDQFLNTLRSLPRYLSEDLERILKCAMRIILGDFKYRDALKMVNINTLYERRELLSLRLFNKISHTIDHKLGFCLHQGLSVKK